MRQRFLLIFYTLCLLSFFQCTEDKLANPLDVELNDRLVSLSATGNVSDFEIPDDGDYASIPQDPQNPITADKINLGKMLFFETGLALAPARPYNAGTYSCGSCHIPTAAFTAGAVQGIADGGVGFGDNGEGRTGIQLYEPSEMDVQGRRPLSMLNTAFVTNTTWSGKFGGGFANEGTEHLWHLDPATEVNFLGLLAMESQVIEGFELHRMVISKEVMDDLGYTKYFDDAFQDIPERERYTRKYASFAISAYLRSLLTNQAPFQKWVKGDMQAMSDAEKRGALVFFDKAGCYKCHKGPALNANEFYALGVKDLYETGLAFDTDESDKAKFGRGEFTGNEEDYYKFKVPQLYNLKEAPFLFHGSSMHTLREAVEYFNDGIPENPNVPASQIAPHFKPLYLTEQEIDELTLFLEKSLYDPVDRHVPEFVLSGNCIPNNDQISQRDLDCN